MANKNFQIELNDSGFDDLIVTKFGGRRANYIKSPSRKKNLKLHMFAQRGFAALALLALAFSITPIQQSEAVSVSFYKELSTADIIRKDLPTFDNGRQPTNDGITTFYIEGYGYFKGSEAIFYYPPELGYSYTRTKIVACTEQVAWTLLDSGCSFRVMYGVGNGDQEGPVGEIIDPQTTETASGLIPGAFAYDGQVGSCVAALSYSTKDPTYSKLRWSGCSPVKKIPSVTVLNYGPHIEISDSGYNSSEIRVGSSLSAEVILKRIGAPISFTQNLSSSFSGMIGGSQSPPEYHDYVDYAETVYKLSKTFTSAGSVTSTYKFQYKDPATGVDLLNGYSRTITTTVLPGAACLEESSIIWVMHDIGNDEKYVIGEDYLEAVPVWRDCYGNVTEFQIGHLNYYQASSSTLGASPLTAGEFTASAFLWLGSSGEVVKSESFEFINKAPLTVVTKQSPAEISISAGSTVSIITDVFYERVHDWLPVPAMMSYSLTSPGGNATTGDVTGTLDFMYGLYNLAPGTHDRFIVAKTLTQPGEYELTTTLSQPNDFGYDDIFLHEDHQDSRTATYSIMVGPGDLDLSRTDGEYPAVMLDLVIDKGARDELGRYDYFGNALRVTAKYQDEFGNEIACDECTVEFSSASNFGSFYSLSGSILSLNAPGALPSSLAILARNGDESQLINFADPEISNAKFAALSADLGMSELGFEIKGEGDLANPDFLSYEDHQIIARAIFRDPKGFPLDKSARKFANAKLQMMHAFPIGASSAGISDSSETVTSAIKYLRPGEYSHKFALSAGSDSIELAGSFTLHAGAARAYTSSVEFKLVKKDESIPYVVFQDDTVSVIPHWKDDFGFATDYKIGSVQAETPLGTALISLSDDSAAWESDGSSWLIYKVCDQPKEICVDYTSPKFTIGDWEIPLLGVADAQKSEEAIAKSEAAEIDAADADKGDAEKSPAQYGGDAIQYEASPDSTSSESEFVDAIGGGEGIGAAKAISSADMILFNLFWIVLLFFAGWLTKTFRKS